MSDETSPVGSLDGFVDALRKRAKEAQSREAAQAFLWVLGSYGGDVARLRDEVQAQHERLVAKDMELDRYENTVVPRLRAELDDERASHAKTADNFEEYAEGVTEKIERLTRERDQLLSDVDASNRMLTKASSAIDSTRERAETAERERDEAIAAAAPGLASLDELTAEIGRQVDSGEFAAGLAIAKDVVGRCVLAWAKHSMGERVNGCRVLVTAPVVILLRSAPEGSPTTGATDEPGEPWCDECEDQGSWACSKHARDA